MAGDDAPAEGARSESMKFLRTSQTLTDLSIGKLRQAGDAEGTKGVIVESAVVTAHSNRELAAATIAAAERTTEAAGLLQRSLDLDADVLNTSLASLNVSIVALADRSDKTADRSDKTASGLNASVATLNASIVALTDRSDKTANKLANWTAVLAIGTILLMLATAALVVVEWRKQESPPVAVIEPVQPAVVPTPTPPAPTPQPPPK